VLLGAALRFYGIGHQGYWYDEAYTVSVLKLPLASMLRQLPHQESTPPLYYCVAWVWSHIFGFGRAGVRSLSALFGTAVIPVAYACGRKLLATRRAALIVAALTAFNPLLIWYSQEARSYQMLVLTGACSLLAFAYARERPQPVAMALWALASAVALMTHYYSILLVIPEAAWLVYEHRYRRAVYTSIGVVAAVGLALLPLLIAQTGTGNDSWIGRTSLLERLAQVIPLFLLGPETPARTVLKFTAFALALAALWLLAFRSRRRERQGALVPGVLGVAGLILSLLLIPISDTFLTRNLLALWLPLALVVATGLATLRARALGIALTLALCGIGATAAIGVAADYSLQRPNWQPVARLLGPQPAQGNRLVLIRHYPGAYPLALYLHGLVYFKKNAATDVTEIDLVGVKDIRHLGKFCWWGSACNLSPSRFPAHYLIPGFHEVWAKRVEQFWVLKVVSDRPVTVTRTALANSLLQSGLKHDTLLIQR
jgi:mannosyltransferase